MPFEFDIPQEERSIIKVVGVGGGGSNAVSHMYRQGIIGVDFAICNTDNQSMESSPVPTKIQLGPMLTEGRGAGSKPSVGKQACLESIDDVKHFLSTDTRMLFITAGMGGGTGTGAAPIIAQAARELGVLTVGIVTVPFSFEGKKRESQANEGLTEMQKNVDALIIVSNDKLREVHGNLILSEAFSKADDILTTAARGIAEIITKSGYVNVDFEDVNTVMRDSGVAIMGTAVAEGEDRAIMAVENALSSPLLEENDIRGARHILSNITSGTKEVTMDEIFQITQYVQEEAGHGTDLIWGNSRDETLKEKLCVTVIATGFEATRVPAHEIKATQSKNPVRVVPLDEDEWQEIEQKEKAVRAHQVEESDDFIRTKRHHPDLSSITSEDDSASDFEQSDRQARHHKKSTDIPSFRRKEHVEELKSLTTERIQSLEHEPAYKRKRVNLDDVGDSNFGGGSSRYSLTHEDQPALRRDNSFLHDNVD